MLNKIVLLSLVTMALISCTTAKPMINNSEAIKIGTEKNIVLVMPTIDHKDIRNDFSQIERDTTNLTSFIQENTISNISQKGYQVNAISSINEMVAKWKEADSTFDIFRKNQGTDSEVVLNKLLETVGSSYILVVKATVYHDLRRTFQFAMNRTQIRAKLLDIQLNKIVWKNEVQYNDLPDVNDVKLKEMIALLYSTISR